MATSTDVGVISFTQTFYNNFSMISQQQQQQQNF